MYRPPNYSDEQWLAYQEAVSQPDRTWALDMTMALDDGTHLELTETDIVAGTLVMKEQSTCSDSIMVGSTYANSLNFSLINGDGRFCDCNFMRAVVAATVKLYIPATETWAQVRLGTFIVQEAGRNYSTISLKCIDSMCLFNRPLSDTHPIFPVQLKNLFMSVCQLVGVSYSTELYDQIPAMMLGAFETDKLTCRDFLAHLGCLIGKNLRISRTGRLEAFWYGDTDYVTTPDTRSSITLEDLYIHPTAVTVKDWNGAEYAPEELDASYILMLDTNPLIQNEETAKTVLAKLNSLLTSVRYRTFDCQFIGNPAVQAGDIITHHSVKGEQQTEPSVEGYVMSHEYRFRSTGRLAALGKTPEQDRQLTATAKKVLNVQTQAAKDLNEGLTSAQQALLQQTNLLTESLALYSGIKYDSQRRLCGYYMASEPIFAPDGIIAPDDSNVDPRTDCYVWTYGGGGVGVSDTGYFGTYSGLTKDKSIVARTITADWIRTGVLSALDNSLQIDMESGEQTIKTLDGWGETVLDGIGALFKYWNKNVTNSNEDGHPSIAYLRITADADEQASTEKQIAADLKLVWSTYNEEMYTSIGHTVIHATNGKTVETYYPFEIKSREPIHIAPSLYFDESLLFDNITMRRTNFVQGNTGVDFLITPKAIPIIPIMDGQVNLINNAGFESNTLSPWVLSSGTWPIISDTAFVHSGTYAAQCPGTSMNRIILPVSALTEIGFYRHPTYIGFWLKAAGNNVDTPYPLYLQSSPSAAVDDVTIYIQPISDGTKWIYASAIIPPMKSDHILQLYTSCLHGYAVDDFYVYDAQNYSREQWDDYVARGAK